MADAQPRRATREPSIRDEHDLLAQPRTLDRPGDHEHLPHPRATLRTLIPDDDHIARLNGVVLKRRHRRLLPLEDPGDALKHLDRHTGVLHDGPLWSQRTGEDRDAAIGRQRIAHRAQDLAIRLRRIDTREILGDGAAGDRQAVPVDQALVEEHLHHDRDAPDSVHVEHHVLTEGLEVGEQGHLGADAMEVVELELEAAFVGDRRKVEHGVRRPAEGHDDGDRILERLHGDDVARRGALAQQFDDGLPRLAPEKRATAVDCRGRG
ncbi:unannotated protein [freshwater metagenome]|uniref:Unannotated protein n=1 Tax=freshwater metagenome TaxID=449393 RepID=A0A6J7JFA4_9ZZZZ